MRGTRPEANEGSVHRDPLDFTSRAQSSDVENLLQPPVILVCCVRHLSDQG